MFAIFVKADGSFGYTATQRPLEGADFHVDRIPKDPVLSEDRQSLRSANDTEVLHRRKEYKRQEMTGARQTALLTLTVDYLGAKWDADEEAVMRTTNAALLWQLAVQAGDVRAPATVEWLDASNTKHDLTLPKLIGLASAAWLAQESRVWAKNTAAKTAIERAATLEELEAIRWE